MVDTDRYFVERLEAFYFALDDLDDAECWQSILYRPAALFDSERTPDKEGEEMIAERLDRLKFWILGALFSVSMAAGGYAVNQMSAADDRIEQTHRRDSESMNERFDRLFERVIQEANANAATRADIQWIKDQLQRALAGK